MQTPYQLEKNEDFERAQALDIEVYVYSIDDINGDPVVVGLITNWDVERKITFINGQPYDQTKFVFLTQGD